MLNPRYARAVAAATSSRSLLRYTSRSTAACTRATAYSTSASYPCLAAFSSSPLLSGHRGAASSPAPASAASRLIARSTSASTTTARCFSGEAATHHHHHHHGGIKEQEEGHRLDRDPGLNPVPNFEDTEAAYRSKSTPELVRAAATFSLCQVPWLVRNAETALTLSRKILGDTITDLVLKNTMYGHFCAGEDGDRIQGKVRALEKNGIGSILDYAAEDEDDGVDQGKKNVL